MELVIREYSSSDFPQIKKLILDAENFGEPNYVEVVGSRGFGEGSGSYET